MRLFCSVGLWLLAVVSASAQTQAPAIRQGFNTKQFGPCLDCSSPLEPIGFTVNFFGVTESSLYVNSHGNVTFGQARPGNFVPEVLQGSIIRIIAPYFADNDMNATDTAVTYGGGTLNGRQAFGVNWLNQGYFLRHGTKKVNFQLILINRADRAAGDFDMEFNYGVMEWEAGGPDVPSQNGNNGLCAGLPNCIPAAVGWSNGLTGAQNRSFEITGSRIAGALIDSNPNGLRYRIQGSTIPGRLIFEVRNGEVVSSISVSPGTVTLSPSQSQQFTAAVSGQTSTAVTWTISPPNIGAITPGGLYTAPASIAAQTTVTVTATSTEDTSRVATATVIVRPPTNCTYNLSSSSISFSAAGGSGEVSLATSGGCPWTAGTSSSFVTITSGGSGSGAGVIRFTVAANATTAPRAGTLTIGGQTFTISQAGTGCTGAITPLSTSVGSGAGTFQVNVAVTSPECIWAASSNIAWASASAPAGGTGNGTLTVSFTANTAAQTRAGTLLVAGVPFILRQAGTDCANVTLGESELSAGAGSGSGLVAVSVGGGCAYSVTSNASFLTVTSGGNPSGPSTVNFNIAANTSNAPRTGTITIGGQTFTVNQSSNSATGISCNVQAPASTATVRSTGRTELLPAFEVECSGRTGGNIFRADLVVTLNAHVSNRVTQPANETTDAVMLAVGGSTIPGRVEGPNAIRFLNIPISEGEPSLFRRFRISGLRADASVVGATQITARVNLRSPVPVTVLNATRTLAQIAQPVVVSRGATRNGETAAQRIVPVLITETSPTVFKQLSEEGSGQNADTGTRIRLVIQGIPNGAAVFAAAASADNKARLFSANADGSGGSAVAGAPRAGGTYSQLTVSNGTANATWELVGSDAAAVDSIELPILVENGAVEGIQFNASLGPVSDVGIASASGPVPRFLNAAAPVPFVNMRIRTTTGMGSRPIAQRTPAPLGGTVTFTHTVTNDSERNADNVTVRNIPSEGFTNPVCTPSTGTCTVLDRGVRVNLGTMAAGAQASVTTTYSVTGLPNCPNCLNNQSQLESPATVGAAQSDPDLNNNSSEALVESVTGCQITLSRNLVTAGSLGGTATVDVQTGPACDWNVATTIPWITLNPSGAVRGPVSLVLTIAPNGVIAPRSATIGIGGRELRIVQASQGCLTTLSTQNSTVPPGGGNFAINVATGDGCAWEAVSAPEWLQLQAPTTGAGSGTVRFNAAASVSTLPRTGFVEVSGERLQIVQQTASTTPNCTYTLSQSMASFSGNGGSGTVSVSTAAGCSWAASSNASWITVTDANAGTGPGTVGYSVAQHTGVQRSATLTIGGQTFTVTQTGQLLSSNGLRFVPITPCRIMETRPEYNFEGRTGSFGPPFMQANETRTLVLPASNVCNIPTSASAYVLNVTVVPRGPLDFVTIWPGGETRPDFWTVRSPDAQIVANSALVKAGPGGTIQVFASNNVDIILDISGYMTDNSAVSNLVFYPMTPCRVIDTRTEYRQPAGPFGPPSMNARETRRFRFPLTPYCQVPVGAAAYSVTITAVPQGALQFLTAWPSGVGQPNISNINSPAGRVLANSVILPASADGSVDVFTFDRTDFLIDINGYFAPDNGQGLLFFPVRQCRVSDTRQAPGPFGGPLFGNEQTRSLPMFSTSCSGVPTNARAYALHTTAIPGGNPMPFLTAWPSGQGQPNASILNAFQGQTVTNSAIVPAGSGGAIDIYAFRQTHVVVDIAGYFARPAAALVERGLTGRIIRYLDTPPAKE
ncbi:MAG: hypothetical protein JNL98_17510 [Bryobacterales bacterium]|nr:hypothetical protein [Bryobacterales bacterium]